MFPQKAGSRTSLVWKQLIYMVNPEQNKKGKPTDNEELLRTPVKGAPEWSAQG